MSDVEYRLLMLEAKFGALLLDDLAAKQAALAQGQWQGWANQSSGTSGGDTGGWIGKVTTAIGPATSATAPGSGVVTLQDFNGTSLSDAATGVTVYSTIDQTIAVGAIVQGKTVVASDQTRYKFVDTVDKCANLS